MKLLTISAFFAGHGGGIELVAGNLVRALAARGHESRWAAADLDPAPGMNGVTPVPLPAHDPAERLLGLPMPLLTPAALRALDRQVATSDALIVHDALYMSSLAAIASARRHQKPWLLVQHIGTIPFTGLPLRMLMAMATHGCTRPVLRRAPELVFISETVRRQFTDIRRERPAHLIFNGVDGQLFHPVESDERAALRRRLAIEGHDEVLLFAGRFVEKKGLNVLRLLAEQRPRSLFLLAGDGPLAPDTWGLPNIRVVGKCRQDHLAALYQVSDVLVLPSIGEGFPLVIQEALASGLPVVCGRGSAEADPGASTYLTGVDVDMGDPQSTTMRFNVALDAIRPEVNVAASRYAREHYSWAANAAQIEQLLVALIDHLAQARDTPGPQVPPASA